MEDQIKTTETHSNESDVSASAETATMEAAVHVIDPSGINSEAASLNPADSGPPEDSGDPKTKKVEAAFESAWKKHLVDFENRLNGQLAAKESLKLLAVEEKLHSAYALDWKYQSNRYFRLVATLRRRIYEGKVGGKIVA